MKKFIILASVIAISMTSVMATETTVVQKNTLQYSQKIDRKPLAKSVKPKINLDKRLNLTEEQKQKANQLRKKSREKMKPVMVELNQKRNELRNLDKENLTDIEREKKAEKLSSDIAKLNQKARDLRVKNMKDFEKILTPEQKKELAKIKAEGRREFRRNHPKKSPFGTPKGEFGKQPFGPAPSVR